MYPHRIRLRGPWQCVFPGEAPRRAGVPWHGTDGAAERVVLSRKFGFPGRIDGHERVWLTVSELRGWAVVTLNGQHLGEARDGPFESDVTQRLAAHNHLEVQVRGDYVGEVALEIRAMAFLKNVRAERVGGMLHVRGHVAGTCDSALELYILVNGRHAHYQALSAGDHFQAEVNDAGSELPVENVRVDLVSISVVWDRIDVAF